MSALATWLASLGVFGIVFVVGRAIQSKERTERITRLAEKAIARDIEARRAGAPEGYIGISSSVGVSLAARR